MKGVVGGGGEGDSLAEAQVAFSSPVQCIIQIIYIDTQGHKILQLWFFNSKHYVPMFVVELGGFIHIDLFSLVHLRIEGTVSREL